MSRNLRTTPFDRSIAARVSAVLQRGLMAKDAIAAAGISESTYYKWVKEGQRAAKKMEAGEQVTSMEVAEAEFSKSVARARAEGKILLVDALTAAAQDKENPRGVQACMFLLERMHPEEFGRRYIRVEQGGLDGAPIRTEGTVRIIVENIGGTIAQPALPIHTVTGEEGEDT